MTPEQHRKLGAMGYFKDNHNPQKELNDQIRIEKGDKYNELKDKYSEDFNAKTINYAKDLVQGSGLNMQGIRYVKNVMDHEGENIELYLDNEDWSYIREKQGMSGIKKEMDRIKKEVTDNALFFLEKEFGYDDPTPRRDSKTNQFEGFFSELKDEELKDYTNRDIDYVKAKQIVKDSIEKSMSNAVKDLPVEE